MTSQLVDRAKHRFAVVQYAFKAGGKEGLAELMQGDLSVP